MRKIEITTSGSVRSSEWEKEDINWVEFVRRCKNPKVMPLSYASFMSLDKDRKAAVKDGAGCYVGATFTGTRRRKQDVEKRTLVTLDIESSMEDPNWDIDDVYDVLDQLGYCSVIYTTQSNGDGNPRCRVVFLTDRDMTCEEYEPVARWLAAKLGWDKIDNTTFDLNRAMYWASVMADGDFRCEDIAGPAVKVDEVLGQYQDWKNPAEWPHSVMDPAFVKRLNVKGDKCQDPTEKKGWIGDFCRVYGIREAIEAFDLPYSIDSESTGTYTDGTTAGGVNIYENKWLYSFHNTDPVSRTLVNSYDLVRVHLFGDDDMSYQEMVELMSNDEAVVEEHQNQTLKGLKNDFSTFESPKMTQSERPERDEHWDWEKELKVKTNKAGDVVSVEKTIPNFVAILENDPKLKGKIRYDNFASILCITGAVPWLDAKACKIFEQKNCYNTPKYRFIDKDLDALMYYISTNYCNLEDKKKLESALSVVANKNSFNDIRKYFRSLPQWDGVPRLETLFVDFLGAEDNKYVRDVTRKTLLAAVMRIMSNDLVKWDNCPILQSRKQGLGKSTLLSKIGMDAYGWFNDSIDNFEDRKYIAEQCTGKLVCELGEMSFMAKNEIEKVKSTLSAKFDTVRFVFKEFTQDVPRRCIFIGTSNQDTILKDQGGNRRFFPIKCDIQKPKYNVFKDLDQDYVNKVWAEAYYLYKQGDEMLDFDDETKKLASICQEEFRDKNPLEGVIEEFVNTPIKSDWYDLKPEIMHYWYSHYPANDMLKNEVDESDKVERDRVCVAEIWELCLNNQLSSLNGNRKASNDIVHVMEHLDGWEKCKGRFGRYGNTTGFKRIKGQKADDNLSDNLN